MYKEVIFTLTFSAESMCDTKCIDMYEIQYQDLNASCVVCGIVYKSWQYKYLPLTFSAAPMSHDTSLMTRSSPGLYLVE